MKDYLSKVKKPNYISDELIKTIDMIAQARDNELAFDKTIIAEIVSLSNAITGEYYVSYQQGKFKAYAPTSLNFIYQKGTNVYVKIPGGDFSAKKLIEGQANSNINTNEFSSPDDGKIIEMMIPFEDKNEYGILAYAEPKSPYYEKVIYENNGEYLNESFKNVFLSYPKIKISADFKNDFKGSFQAGNFGLSVEFYTENADGTQNLDRTITRRLEVGYGGFSGSLSSYQAYAPQYSTYEITNITLTNIKKITFFQERFQEYDTVYDSQGEKIFVNDSTPNIFVRNVKIAFCALSNDKEKMYQVYAKPRGDLTLATNESRVQLEGLFYYLDQNILDADSCVCKWFKQNPEITIASEFYNSDIGPGWEEIVDPELVDFNLLTVRGIDVYQKLNIKLLIIYKNKAFPMVEPVTLYKQGNNRFAIVKTENENGPILKLLDGSTAGLKEVIWYALLEDGTYEQCNYESSLELNISNYMRYSKVEFYASITLADGETKVFYDYTLINDLLFGKVNVVFAGQDTFLYDANGNISYTEETTELSLMPSITYGENVVPKNIYWVGPGDVTILQIAYSYDYSMLTNMRVDSQSNKLYFKIKNRFDNSKNVNTLKLVVETTDGDIYYFNKNINFVKEGSQGTNGLTYTMIVEQCDVEGKTIEDGIQPMIYNPLTKAWSSIYLRLHVRENGSEIYDGQKVYINGQQTGSYSITYRYEPINVSVNLQNGVYTITGIEAPDSDNITELTKQGQYFVKLSAEIVVNENTTIVTLYYPILIGVGQLKPEQFQLNNLPKEIIYNTSGEPSYNDNAISVLYNGQPLIPLSVPQSLNNNLFIQEFISYQNDLNGERSYRIYPTSSYQGAYFPTSAETNKTLTAMGAIKIKLTGFVANTYIIQPVVMLLSTELNQKIQGYNGTQVTIVDEDTVDLEDTKDINSALGLGKIDPNYGTFCDGLVIGTETGTNKSGIYLIDDNNSPTNTIKNDGSINLGNGIFTANKKEDGGMRFSILGLFSVETDSQGKATYISLQEQFENTIKDLIKKNGETN